MPLAPGDRVGGYEIGARLGAGGMGEVYRARDLRLGRDVAVKILSPAIAADPDGLMRFEREARVLASLNHPNIAAIYGVEDGAGHQALILELVDGDTLADRIAQGPIPQHDALTYAGQIADALDTAHDAGIVHRDLKPANIKVSENGSIKVLDFGLAKAVAAAVGGDSAIDPAQSPTITVHGTKQGVILGTAAYMSPEQARGKKVDKRTDIWAFGCVLFEMLTGRMAFRGETTSDVIAAIIEREPNWSALPRSVPPHIRRVIERCLQKDPKRRARDIGDVRVALTDDAAPTPPMRHGAARSAGIAAAALLLVLAAVAAWQWPTPSPPTPPVELTFAAPSGALGNGPALPSPDGSLLAFVVRPSEGPSSIWLRSLGNSTPRKLEGTDGAGERLFWSPDGRFLGFFVGTAAKRVPTDGGPVVTIATGGANLGASWSRDDVIIIAPVNRGPIMRVAASGGDLTPVTTLDPQRENSHRWPHFLPDGRHFFFTVRSDKPENQGIRLGSLDSPVSKPLINVASQGVYVEPGWILYSTPDAVLMAQRFDTDTLSVSGPPAPVAANVRYNGPGAHGFFAAALNGSVLSYLSMPRGASRLVWFDRTGRHLGAAGPERPYADLRLSPDGRRAAVVLADERIGTRDIWIVDLATHALTRATADPATDWRSTWSPDGVSMAFASDRMGLSSVFRLSTVSDGTDSLVYRAASGGAFPNDWSRDGARLLVHLDDANGRPTTLLDVKADGTSVTPIIAAGTARINMARFSPDARLVSFNADSTGTFETYVMSLADGRRTRVSTAGGLSPLWGRNGRELFYATPDGDVMVSAIASGGDLTASAPTRLFKPCASFPESPAFRVSNTEITLDVTQDGSRFLARCDSADAVPAFVTVTVNWQSRLR